MQAKVTKRDKNFQLITLLQTKGEQAFRHLVRILAVNQKQMHLAVILDPFFPQERLGMARVTSERSAPGTNISEQLNSFAFL